MLNLKTKIVVVGLICVMPTYMMGRCTGSLTNQGATGSCNGQAFQLSTTSIHTENKKLTQEVFDQILIVSDTVNDIQRNTSIAKEGLRISKRAFNSIQRIELDIKQTERQLAQLSHNSQKRVALERMISGLMEQLSIATENSSIELSRLHSQNAIETAHLRSQISQSNTQSYQLKQELKYKEKKNKGLKQLIQASADIVSYSISNTFQNYQTCVEHNDVLARLLLTPVKQNNKGGGSLFGIGSGGSSHMSSNYSQIFSTLSGMSVSAQSLEACSDNFKSLHDKFVLYEVGLALFLNPNNQSVVNYLFKKFGHPNPNPKEIQRFMNAFQTFPKSDLINLINSISSYMNR